MCALAYICRSLSYLALSAASLSTFSGTPPSRPPNGPLRLPSLELKAPQFGITQRPYTLLGSRLMSCARNDVRTSQKRQSYRQIVRIPLLSS
ncbi:hypothetical protein BKA58DRAFT_392995 [Alternaria rosae]|uniref:uncharacterized protein n=1 Tax=Alternaria rosae TaxID=1187941 RepID=UPI001E8ECD39|nr:uncharacterized protein BKA58DRAFT_392995 [Alternaria rosae]KAH6861177.1 hypothetical protein BKA58DRAFT_392995 [Alternaria rosae]